MGLHYVDEKAAAEILGLSVKTLQNWRWRHVGPAYTRMNGKMIRYKVEDLTLYAEGGRVETRGALAGGRERR